MNKSAWILILWIVVPAIPGCTQLYPIDQLPTPTVTSHPDHTVHIDLWPTISEYIRRVDTQPDQIVVTFERCKYCKDGGRIEIENPRNLPVYFSDGTVTKQVYPVNELAKNPRSAEL